jgi:hypothetical protein
MMFFPHIDSPALSWPWGINKKSGSQAPAFVQGWTYAAEAMDGRERLGEIHQVRGALKSFSPGAGFKSR